MDIMDVREYLVSLPAVEECQPFVEEWLVYKVGGRMFAAYGFERPQYLPVKCNPDRAILLRDEFPAITPAWHFNKRHWNDLRFEALPDEVVMREIRHSFLTVIRKNVTPAALREELLKMVAEAGVADASLDL